MTVKNSLDTIMMTIQTKNGMATMNVGLSSPIILSTNLPKITAGKFVRNRLST